MFKLWHGGLYQVMNWWGIKPLAFLCVKLGIIGAGSQGTLADYIHIMWEAYPTKACGRHIETTRKPTLAHVMDRPLLLPAARTALPSVSSRDLHMHAMHLPLQKNHNQSLLQLPVPILYNLVHVIWNALAGDLCEYSMLFANPCVPTALGTPICAWGKPPYIQIQATINASSLLYTNIKTCRTSHIRKFVGHVDTKI